MKKYLFYIIVAQFLALSLLGKWYSNQRTERLRLQTNQSALFADVKRYKVRDSLNAMSVSRLVLDKKELKEYSESLVQDINDLNIRIRRLQSASSTATKTEYKIVTKFKDSLVYVNSQPDTIRCLHFDNNYLTLHGCEQEGYFSGSIISRDTLTHIAHRVPRKFLFFRYGTKAIRQEVLSANPYTEIQYSTYIEFKK